MAVKDDIDICLNITGDSNFSKNQTLSVKNDTKLTKLNKKSVDKLKKPYEKFHSSENSKSLLVGAKKRIKQKGLAFIVSNNLKKLNNPSEAPKSSILKKFVSKKLKSSSISENATKSTNLLLDNNKNKGTESNEPLVSFIKPKKANAFKSIVVRKRKIDHNGSKQTLSDIFNVADSVEEPLNANIVTVSKTNDSVVKTQAKKVFEKQSLSTEEEIGTKDNECSNNLKQFTEKVKKKKRNKSDSNEVNVSGHSRQSGKISSLFGHNPTVPNIGQRFVKPVNEQVFSAEKFSELGIHDFSVSNLEQNMKITTMTTVQKKAIPVILSGNDVLIRSQTGSGKTLSYALPIIEKLQSIRPKLSRNCGIKALIIVPTRELALQTYECFLKLIKPFTWIVPGYLVGGEKRKSEKARLRKGCTVLVATPGRLLDHLKHTQALNLNCINCFVLDEADRMLDMGYEKDISEIVNALENATLTCDNSGYDALKMLKQHIKPANKHEHNKYSNSNNEIDIDHENSDNENELVTTKEKHLESDEYSEDKLESKESKIITEDKLQKRQTILLSATLTNAVEKLAGLTMHDPVFVDAAKENIEAVGGKVSEVNEDLIVPESVVQSYIVTPPKLRMVTLSAFIAGKCQSNGNHKTLIFMATQDMIDYHAEILSSILNKPIDEEDEDSDPLVDVEFFKLHGNMTQKERTEIFKTFRQATSGVLLCTDVAARGLDLPKVDTVVQYTGPTSTRDYVHRIGRTARAGSSGTATIFLTPPEVEFVRMLEARRIRIKQESMDDVLEKLLGPLSKHLSVQAAATDLQNDFENLVLESKKFYTMACKAYTSWVRFYSSYPHEMREAFNRRELHLGHYAKSFALRDPPQKIGGAGRSIREREEAQRPKHNNRLSNQRAEGVSGRPDEDGKAKRQKDRNVSALKKVRMLNVSEYDSGLEPVKKSKKS